ncbi:hypothetical protein N0V95_001814 [Ascochyta clinopodiicola]|nr:hypothetical protein N0V95_001814 [Ascochyta clinopodiicola]
MKARPLPTTGDVFGFPDFPAELLNTIYEFICDGTPVKLIRRRPGTHQVHSYQSFAQTNRQTRRDLLPVYHRSIAPHFSFDDTIEFTRDFLAPRIIKLDSQIITLELTRITGDRNLAV